ncbi:hypothetical protein OK015_04400 [Mycobacterium sp. Aquia_216]|uniref:hypothetical protein n=1 Tax=Mycobacterium sp. Aquia_216 TaxID=2991729 RepID=UPI00227C23E0|nr:hypothetical protein [Mycobacterium sp. Aquia_216]WAJ45753.1 hypothetical protein OK015_04400 [Mycobacterium sp. Aquia_216]
MTDIAVGARRPTVNKRISPDRISAPRNSTGRQIARRVADTVIGVCAAVVTPRRREMPAQPRYHRRESFVEDAAMSREMFRL